MAIHQELQTMTSLLHNRLENHYTVNNVIKNDTFLEKKKRDQMKTDINMIHMITKDICKYINEMQIYETWQTLKNGVQATIDINVAHKISQFHVCLNWKRHKMLKCKAILHKHERQTGSNKEYKQLQNDNNQKAE